MTTATDDWTIFEQINCDAIAEHGRENEDEIDRRMVAEIADIVRKTLRPRPKMDVDQCADKYRVMVGGTTADVGRFKTSTYEVGRGPMMACTERGVAVVTACAAVQIYKTTLLENVFLHGIIVDPGPMIAIQPSKRAAKVFSLSKLKPMLYACKEARALLTKYTTDRVYFVGGDITIVGAGSETDLSMVPRKKCGSDEINKYANIKGGDPMTMGEDRLESYDEEALAVRVCSPEFADSPIAKSVEEGDIRKPFVKCPHCQHEQLMRWSINRGRPDEKRLVRWDEDVTGRWNPRTIRYHCVDCDEPWTNAQRLHAIQNVRWKQTRPFTCCVDHAEQGGGYQEPEITRRWVDSYRESDGRHRVAYAICAVCEEQRVPNEHASFDVANRLYSPKSLSKLVRKFKGALASPSKMKIFVNQQLCEVWKDETEVQMSLDGLAARLEDYAQEVPDRVAELVAGVDIQETWFEAVVLGVGRSNETWVIAHHRVVGDFSELAVQQKLDDILYKEYRGKGGRPFKIEQTSVDSGYKTTSVYRYCRARLDQRIYPTKGWNESGRNHKPVWPPNPSFGGAMKVPVYMVGTISAKTDFFSFLGRSPGPGFIHMPRSVAGDLARGVDHEFLRGLLSERKLKVPGGYKYVPKSDDTRNEPLDCWCLAYAAAEGLRQAHKDVLHFDRIADQLLIPRELTDAEGKRFNRDSKVEIEKATKGALDKLATKRPSRMPNPPAPAVPETIAGTKVAQIDTQPIPSAPSGRLADRREGSSLPSRFPQIAKRSGNRPGGGSPF